MIRIGDKPLVERLIDHLNKYGIKEIIVNLHYKPEVFMEHLGGKVLYFYEPKLLGEPKTTEVLKDWLGDTFVCMNGDTLTNVNINDMLKFHKRENADMTIYSEGDTAAGTWIYTKGYFTKEAIKVSKYQTLSAYWHDIGTPESLGKARLLYA